jgi:hypothetical protein
MPPEKTLGAEIVDIIKSADLAPLVGDLIEAGIDSISSEGLLKELPVLGTIWKLGKAGLSISDRLFTRKLGQFLFALAQVDKADLQSMAYRLESEESFRGKVGERIVELLDRADSVRKPEMLAKAFAAYARQSIDIEMLNRLHHTIQQLPHFEQKTVRRFHDATPEERTKMSVDSLQTLAAAGLARPLSAWDSIVYEPSDVCSVFVSLNLDIGFEE